MPYKDKKGKTHVLEGMVQKDSSQGYSRSSGSTYNMFSITAGRGSLPWKVTVCVNVVNLKMEVDSGATFSVIGEKPAVHVGFTVSAPAVAGEVADFHW